MFDAGIDGGIVEDFARRFMHEDRERHAPGALARQHPIGAAFHHRADAVRAGLRIPFGVADALHGELAQRFAVVNRLVHRREPLRRGPEDHRRLGAPGMRIGVAQRPFGEERVCGDQFFDDRAVGVAIFAFGRENALAGEDRNLRIERTIRTDDVESVGMLRRILLVQSDQQLEVVFAVTRSGVHKARAGIGSDVLTGKQKDIKVVTSAMKWMPACEAEWIYCADTMKFHLCVGGSLLSKQICK